MANLTGGPGLENPRSLTTRKLRRSDVAGMDAELSSFSPLRDGRAAQNAGNGIFANCANAGCKSGWLKLWRSRSAPVFEGGWTCSPDCTLTQVESALRREMEARGAADENHRHRIPLGLA